MKRLLTAALTALPIIAMSAAGLAEDSKDPLKMTLHDWTGQLITTQLMGEALKKAGHPMDKSNFAGQKGKK